MTQMHLAGMVIDNAEHKHQLEVRHLHLSG